MIVFSKCVFIKRFMGEKTTMGKHTAWLFWANKTNFIIVIFYNSLLSLEGRWNETRVATRFILLAKIFMQLLSIRWKYGANDAVKVFFQLYPNKHKFNFQLS